MELHDALVALAELVHKMTLKLQELEYRVRALEGNEP